MISVLVTASEGSWLDSGRRHQSIVFLNLKLFASPTEVYVQPAEPGPCMKPRSGATVLGPDTCDVDQSHRQPAVGGQAVQERSGYPPRAALSSSVDLSFGVTGA